MVTVLTDAAAAVHATAEYMAERASEAVRERGEFRLAVGGGSTPRDLYRLLAAGYRERVAWPQVHLFLGDERCVPLDDPDSNYRMVKETLTDHVPIGGVYPVPVELPPSEAAWRYAETLGSSPLDLVLLGMGYDGHTASLFSGIDLDSGSRVLHTRSPVPPYDRVSLSLATINEARAAAFLVTGAAKAERLAAVRAQGSAPELPAARVRPQSGELRWFVDRAAAEEL
jgi:6-phosphogluconolactonase